MSEKFRRKYRIDSARLKGYDYGSDGMYFITICTKDRLHYFGKIELEENNIFHGFSGWPCPVLQATEIGKIAIRYWLEIPEHFPFVRLDEFVIMPDHLHGILFFEKPNKTDWVENKFGPQSQNLGSVLRGFKSTVKRYANENKISFAWQSRYYDRIIRNLDELERIRRYIINNPDKWYDEKSKCAK